MLMKSAEAYIARHVAQKPELAELRAPCAGNTIMTSSGMPAGYGLRAVSK